MTYKDMTFCNNDDCPFYHECARAIENLPKYNKIVISVSHLQCDSQDDSVFISKE